MRVTNKHQDEFAGMVALLILYVRAIPGYSISLGDAWSKPEYNAHKKNSLHYKRLAIDINLFINGKYQTTTEAHRPLGEYWEKIGGSWGGRFKDGNHYEYKLK